MNNWFVTLGNFEIFMEPSNESGWFCKVIREPMNTHIWLFNKFHILISNNGERQ